MQQSNLFSPDTDSNTSTQGFYRYQSYPSDTVLSFSQKICEHLCVEVIGIIFMLGNMEAGIAVELKTAP